MTAKRLSKELRRTIAQRATAQANEKERKELEERSHEIGMRGYETIFDQEVRAMAAWMPAGWVSKDLCLRFNANGWDVKFTVKEAVPVPSSSGFGCHMLGSVAGDLGTEMQKLATDIKTFKEEGDSAYRKVLAMLNQFVTFKQLRENWPEGHQFYKDLDADDVAKVPAVRIAEINALLGLPREEDNEEQGTVDAGGSEPSEPIPEDG